MIQKKTDQFLQCLVNVLCDSPGSNKISSTSFQLLRFFTFTSL